MKPAADAQLPPLFKQYWEIKRQYPDVLLMLRIGDFYELFGDDAVSAAAILEITLTSRDHFGGERIPMCGVPYHAVERYVARLVGAGQRVALCDQMEDARFAKGLVRRKVTRVLTPGTVVEEAMLEARASSFLVALTSSSTEWESAEVGLAVCDVSTGEFLVTEFRGPGAASRAMDELDRLAPREVVVADDLELAWGDRLRGAGPWAVSPMGRTPGPADGRRLLLEHFGVTSLEGFGCAEMPLAIQAAAVVVAYAGHRQLDVRGHLRTLATYSTRECMTLDSIARRHLELTHQLWETGRAHTLVGVLDATRTAMGGRMLRRWIERPLLDPAAIGVRLDAVEEFTGSALLRGDVAEGLGGVSDLERLTSRCATGTASPRDLGSLRVSLRKLPGLHELLADCRSERLSALRMGLEPEEEVEALADHLERYLVEEPPAVMREGGIIRDGVHPPLDELRAASSGGKEWLAALEATERDRTGIKSLKVGYTGVFGYFIEVTRPNLGLVPPEYIRKQTTANAERFITPELKEREALILGAEERMLEMEQRLFQDLRLRVARSASALLRIAAVAAELDVLQSFAEKSVRGDYCRPEVDAGDTIEIVGGRHPVVERLGGDPFVPNDLTMDGADRRMMVITGPNMAGKSTYLRQAALIAVMAQAGCFVPAQRARMGVIDRIFTRVGAHDDLSAGKSTFMVEMTETANILNNAGPRSLVILDEIGRGTSTYDGLSIAWAVAEHLAAVGAKTLFATHYHHLNELAERVPGVRNFRADVREEVDRIVWLHKIVPGGTDRSYGIQVARLAGLPPEVVARAHEVLADLEAGKSGQPAPPAGTRVNATRKSVQLSLFELSENPIVEEIRGLDLSSLTPIEALTKLYQLQQRAG